MNETRRLEHLIPRRAEVNEVAFRSADFNVLVVESLLGDGGDAVFFAAGGVVVADEDLVVGGEGEEFLEGLGGGVRVVLRDESLERTRYKARASPPGKSARAEPRSGYEGGRMS